MNRIRNLFGAAFPIIAQPRSPRRRVWRHVRSFQTVNGVIDNGGSLDAAGPTIAGGMLS
jgi:hypothetical protein